MPTVLSHDTETCPLKLTSEMKGSVICYWNVPVSPTPISPIPISSTLILPTVKNVFTPFSPTRRKFSNYVFFLNSFIYLYMFIPFLFHYFYLLSLSVYLLIMLIDNY